MDAKKIAMKLMELIEKLSNFNPFALNVDKAVKPLTSIVDKLDKVKERKQESVTRIKELQEKLDEDLDEAFVEIEKAVNFKEFLEKAGLK